MRPSPETATRSLRIAGAIVKDLLGWKEVIGELAV
jgi:hypothetical protein